MKESDTLDVKVSEIVSSGSGCVLLCGISASGKTTVARRLEAHGYRRYSVDLFLWERYGKEFQSFPFEEQRRLTLDAEKAVIAEMKRSLSAGEKVVVDSALCKIFKRKMFVEGAREVGCEPSLFWVRASLEESLRRIRMRRGEGPDDIIVPEKQLRGFFKGFEVPQPDEEATEIITG